MRRVVVSLVLSFCLAFNVHASSISLDVTLQGLPKSVEEQVLGSIRIVEAQKEPKLSRTRVYNLHYLAEEQIEKILQSLGYYSSEIDSNLEERPGQAMVASYNIKLGPATTIRSITFQVEGAAKTVAKFSKLPEGKLAENQQLNHQNYEQTKEAILSRFVAEGYLDATFLISEILVDIEEHHADIVLVVDSGPQYVFGPVTFLETDYDPLVLHRYVPFYQGEPYTQKKLSNLRKNLFKADLFSKVRVKSEKNHETPANDVNILVKTQSKPVNHYFGKVGYSTDKLLNAELGWHHRIKPNAHHLRMTTSASQVLQQGNFLYQIPGRYAATDTYEFAANARREKFDEIYTYLAKFEAAKIHKRNRLRTRFGLTYHQELYQLLTTEKEHSHFVLPNLRLTWVNKMENDDRGCGQKLDFTVKAGSRYLLSTTDFVKLKFHTHINHCLGDNTIFIFKGTVGTIYVDGFEQVPTSLRFYTGGDRTIRGFRYRSLGPQRVNANEKEVNIGGRHLLQGSVELERRIWKDLGAAAFFDAGNALSRWEDSLARSAGVGLRYHTPLGPFRLDFAKPLSDHGKRNIRFHLTFGWDL